MLSGVKSACGHWHEDTANDCYWVGNVHRETFAS